MALGQDRISPCMHRAMFMLMFMHTGPAYWAEVNQRNIAPKGQVTMKQCAVRLQPSRSKETRAERKMRECAERQQRILDDIERRRERKLAKKAARAHSRGKRSKARGRSCRESPSPSESDSSSSAASR
jgi:hypothetical protein